MKYNQGHWKWYEWVTLSEYYHHAKFDIYHIYSVREKCNIYVFATYGHYISKPNKVFHLAQQGLLPWTANPPPHVPNDTVQWYCQYVTALLYLVFLLAIVNQHI